MSKAKMLQKSYLRNCFKLDCDIVQLKLLFIFDYWINL